MPFESPEESGSAKAGNQSKPNDGREPHACHGDSNSVEVSFSHRGATEIAGDATAEHVGHAAAAALVHQDQQNEKDAAQNQQRLAGNLENVHEVELTTLAGNRRASWPVCIRPGYRANVSRLLYEPER